MWKPASIGTAVALALVLHSASATAAGIFLLKQQEYDACISQGIEPLAKEARAAGKPLLCWLLGRRQKARTYETGARELGIPVFRELQRAVECMAAVFRSRPGAC